MKLNEESFKAWEQDHIEFLTSRYMGEWLYRRDMNARPKGDLISREALREQIADCEYFNSSFQKMTVAEFLTIIYDIINKEVENGES